MKSRVREICKHGSVRGRGSNPPVYSTHLSFVFVLLARDIEKSIARESAQKGIEGEEEDKKRLKAQDPLENSELEGIKKIQDDLLDLAGNTPGSGEEIISMLDTFISENMLKGSQDDINGAGIKSSREIYAPDIKGMPPKLSDF